MRFTLSKNCFVIAKKKNSSVCCGDTHICYISINAVQKQPLSHKWRRQFASKIIFYTVYFINRPDIYGVCSYTTTNIPLTLLSFLTFRESLYLVGKFSALKLVQKLLFCVRLAQHTRFIFFFSDIILHFTAVLKMEECLYSLMKKKKI